MFRRILIANRGEIACRIARTCRVLGVEYVAVYSDADAHSPHLKGAVETVCVGPAPAASSYLGVERVVRAGVETGCDGVHPGYGFLSENADFARAVASAGMIFIGPLPETIESMGDKARAKALMRDADVPVVPGTEEASEDPQRIAALAEEIGFPVLLKPVAGGGGKGMTVLENADDVLAAVQAAVRLSRASFGDGRLLVELFVRRSRHIEVQVFGDADGNVVHLFERECSLQRRHQKIVEESPAANLPEPTRDALRRAAIAGARALGYRNAGTFEFIVSPDGEFYFLEVNTRLQVEHPVTEMVTGLDLVEWQFRVAAGEVLPLSQDALRCSGHAIECRIYAEDPVAEFAPSPGNVLALDWPAAARVDAGIVAGGEVTAFYDPLVAKIVVHDANRTGALTRIQRSLTDTVLLGLTTNLGFLIDLLSRPEVLRGTVHTGFVDAHSGELGNPGESRVAACAAAFELTATADGSAACSPWCEAGAVGPLDRVHLDPSAPFGRITAYIHREPRDARVKAWAGGEATVEVSGAVHTVVVERDPATGIRRGRIDGLHQWAAIRHGDTLELQIMGSRARVATKAIHGLGDDAGGNVAISPMPAIVAAVHVEVGQRVATGDVVVVVDAMKMETTVTAPVDGTVADLHCAPGDSVEAGEVLAVIDEERVESSRAVGGDVTETSRC